MAVAEVVRRYICSCWNRAKTRPKDCR